MRISDWSSDVCSSDLIGAQRVGALDLDRAEPIAAPHALPYPDIERDQHPALGRRDPRGGAIGDAPARHGWGACLGAAGEVGRPSCRESVCMYAYISVSSGSLTHQIQI